MKEGQHRYKYAKQLNGFGRYGEIELDIKISKTKSIVVDDCQWKTLKTSYSKFEEINTLKNWKKSALLAAETLLECYELPEPIEIKIKDIVGLYVDTTPTCIGIAVVIGVFDYLEHPLNQEDLIRLDDFVSKNNSFEVIPDFTELTIWGLKRKKTV